MAYENKIDLQTLIVGYERALKRFRDVVNEPDSAELYYPLFEALNWAVSIDERMEYPDLPALRGLRFVRNNVHHQWSDALWLDESGFTFPRTFPMVFFEWRWREDLTPDSSGESKWDKKNKIAYQETLAGQPARFALNELLEYLRLETVREVSTR